MNVINHINYLASKFLLVLLILSQLFNAFLVTDYIINKEKTAFNIDFDNSSKEDKNSLDCEEESKILDNSLYAIYFSNESNTINFIVQNHTEVPKKGDFPPPKQPFRLYFLL